MAAYFSQHLISLSQVTPRKALIRVTVYGVVTGRHRVQWETLSSTLSTVSVLLAPCFRLLLLFLNKEFKAWFQVKHFSLETKTPRLTHAKGIKKRGVASVTLSCPLKGHVNSVCKHWARISN